MRLRVPSSRHILVVFACATISVLPCAAATTTPAQLFQSLASGGWTDDKIVQLATAMAAANTMESDAHLLDQAISNPMFPEEGRPANFFNTLSSYFDENHDGHFTTKEVDGIAQKYEGRYAELLRESLAPGPSQSLTVAYRVKTWKMLQKILLLKKTLAERGLGEWPYTPFGRPTASEAWDKDHTVTGEADFRRRICEASASRTVVVKFGSTQCADCTLMEYSQGIRTAAEKQADKVDLYKLWWGPNLPEENDRLRKAEGVKSSPTFIVYRGGQRYTCGFAFLDETGTGLEACLAGATKADARSSGSCGVAVQ